MRQKLWPKAPAKEGAFFQGYFIHINFLRNQKQFTIEPELYCDAILFIFWFFIVYFQKKMEIEKWPMAADSPLTKIG